MSTLVYAKHVECDWPDCQSQGEVSLKDMRVSSGYELPVGWLNLRPYIIRSDGVIIGELCSIHARVNVTDLVKILEGPKK